MFSFTQQMRLDAIDTIHTTRRHTTDDLETTGKEGPPGERQRSSSLVRISVSRFPTSRTSFGFSLLFSAACTKGGMGLGEKTPSSSHCASWLGIWVFAGWRVEWVD
jgi:hypothetical protein